MRDRASSLAIMHSSGWKLGLKLDGRIESGEQENCPVRNCSRETSIGQNINEWWWASFVQSLRPARETSNSLPFFYLKERDAYHLQKYPLMFFIY